MDRQNTVCFIGHRDCYDLNEDALYAAIRNMIEKGVLYFLNGGMGGFDMRCARAVYELKRYYSQIRNYLVIPYLNLHISRKEYFDEIIFPDGLEDKHFKAAIPARNRYMVDHSAYAVCYLRHSWGGAMQTYRYACGKKLVIVDL